MAPRWDQPCRLGGLRHPLEELLLFRGPAATLVPQLFIGRQNNTLLHKRLAAVLDFNLQISQYKSAAGHRV